MLKIKKINNDKSPRPLYQFENFLMPTHCHIDGTNIIRFPISVNIFIFILRNYFNNLRHFILNLYFKKKKYLNLLFKSFIIIFNFKNFKIQQDFT